MTAWRILRDGALPPARNMAVDEAVFLLHGKEKWDATLRFYEWSPAALSLGHAQELSSATNEDACRARGVAVVRRPTGGWAVLHADEITYSVVSSAEGESFRSCDLGETYRRIAQAFVAGLKRLGVPVSLVARTEETLPAKSAIPCFEVPARHEIATGDGRKLVGSAQRRMKETFLQHGSVPLTLDRALLYAVTGQKPREGKEKFAALNEISPSPLTRDALREALEEGFKEAFGVSLEPGALTPEEEALAARLEREKYASEAWTRERLDKGKADPCGSASH